MWGDPCTVQTAGSRGMWELELCILGLLRIGVGVLLAFPLRFLYVAVLCVRERE